VIAGKFFGSFDNFLAASSRCDFIFGNFDFLDKSFVGADGGFGGSANFGTGGMYGWIRSRIGIFGSATGSIYSDGMLFEDNFSQLKEIF
jgi:hypothetical protein